MSPISGVVTVGGVEYPVQTEVDLPDQNRSQDEVRPGRYPNG